MSVPRVGLNELVALYKLLHLLKPWADRVGVWDLYLSRAAIAMSEAITIIKQEQKHVSH
ncbi:MAG: hypothetical protein V3S33_06020 [Gammaproteobacteria bacterium]